MSKVAITGNASGTGTFTIAAPNSNTDRTLNLPDSAGTLLHDSSSLAAANLTGTIDKARLPAGSVLQVLSTSYGTLTSTTSGSYVNLMGITVTPASSSSKFLLLANLAASGRGIFNLFRDSTQIHSHSSDPYIMWGFNQTAWNNNSMRAPFTVTALDSPATASAITYSVQMRSRSSTEGIGINENTSGSTFSNFILMEIAA